ncbi:MAG: chromate transporter [Firmicutes bacterium]|nr:chromate transporter [Bacillota bacterium]
MLLELFITFTYLGFSSFGGGFVLLSLIESQIVSKLHWINHEQFVMAVAAGQMSPGPVAIAGSFTGFLVGYNHYHTIPMAILCAFLAWIGTSISTPVCMTILIKVYNKINDAALADRISLYVTPVVIGIILYLGVKMGAESITVWQQILIAFIAFILTWTKKLDIAVTIISAGVIGYFLL